MERKIVVHKTEHELFEYGRPYYADVIGSKLRIQDNDFTGNSYTVYDANKFYVHKELDKASKEDDVIYSRCMTMKYLETYKGFVLLRGYYFMSCDGDVQSDTDCYYLYNPCSKEDKGHYHEEHFSSEIKAIEFIKKVIDFNDDEDNENYPGLDDLGKFGESFVYIMNVNDMLQYDKEVMETELNEATL